MRDEIRFSDHAAGTKIMELAGGAVFNPQGEAVISRHIDDKFVGGIVYANYTGAGGSIEMHTGSVRPIWVNRDILWAAFDYPFKQLGCVKVLGRVKENNFSALAFFYNLGFTVETTVVDVYPDCGLHVIGMYADKCRWLDLKPRSIRTNRS